MEPISRLEGRAAPLALANIDTDQIIPAQFLKTIERKGLGKGLFTPLRFNPDGTPKPEFVLNQPAYKDSSILIAGDNFGCGSSREHAPWALMDYGIRAIVAPSFADIFFNNSAENGLLLIRAPQADVDKLMDEAKGGNHLFAIDLEAQTITAPSGTVFTFEIEPGRKEKLLKGLDSIGSTLQHKSEIDAFEERRKLTQPWVAA